MKVAISLRFAWCCFLGVRDFPLWDRNGISGARPSLPDILCAILTRAQNIYYKIC